MIDIDRLAIICLTLVTLGAIIGVSVYQVNDRVLMANNIEKAIAKGIDDAKKNLLKVPVMHGTIPHEQWAKQGAAKVLIKPAAHGAGVIAGGSMRAVLESAGITDVLAKSLGSANPHNVVKATLKALSLLREPVQVAKTRSVKLSKVFNG